MMFMDRSKYEEQAAAVSSQFYKDDNQSLIGNYSSQFQQYELETMDAPRHICPVCDKTFRASSLLDIHMRVHVGAKPFVCPVCNHRATQKGNLKLHMKKHHGQDLPSHIDLTPDSGIWGNFSTSDNSDETELNCQLSNKKKTTLAHSSLLNEDVVELIKKCQNSIGQSTMGRITESLNDFLDIAQQKVRSGSLSSKNALQKEEISYENLNSNNNRIEQGTFEIDKNPVCVMTAPAENYNFSTKPNVQENTSSKNFCYCKICGWKTTSSGYLNVHMRKHKAESHICTLCGRAFKETWYLKNHMRSHVNDLISDPVLNFAESNIARENTELESSFQDEELIHKENNEKAAYSMCSKCGFIFSKQSLPAHSETCGKEQERIADSDILEFSYSKATFMKTLQLTNKICREKNGQLPYLKHFDAMISNAVVHSRDICSQDAKLSENSNSKPSSNPLHLLKKEIENSIVQNGIEATKKSFQELIKNPDFKILLSSKHLHSIAELFNTKESILKSDGSVNHHILMKGKMKLSPSHNPSKNSAMQLLASTGKSLDVEKSALTDHSVDSSSVVQPIQRYKCEYCSKWFKYKSVLSIHMRSHTGERPYKCTYCDYAGTQHNCLKVHLQRHHPEIYEAQNEERIAKAKNIEVSEVVEQEELFVSQNSRFSPARCPICDRVSPSPGYLKIHMRSHKTTLDHVCHICGRGFKEYWYLSTHLRTHDNEINTSTGPVEEFQHFGTNLDLPKASARMHSVPLRKEHLTKQQSVPLDTRDRNHLGHSYLSGTSSWSPLDRHEEFYETHYSIHPRPCEVSPEPPRPHVSKRKAFQPSRHRPEPYVAHEPRSRKSKPRKFSHGNYLVPTFESLPFASSENLDQEDVETAETLTTLNACAAAEQPLDLTVSIATSTISTKEEPLNLAIK